MCLARKTLSGEEINDVLWPQGTLDSSGGPLRRNIYLVRRALFPDSILAEEVGYVINPMVPVEFDIDEFLSNLKLANDP